MAATFIFLLLTGLIFYAAVCSAKMDIVDDRWSVSVYKSQHRPEQWFNPVLSWTNKNHADIWRVLALQYLPKYIHWLAAMKPAWSPLSDFWHWEKAKCLVSLLTAISISFVYGINLSLSQPWGYVVSCLAATFFGTVWNLTFTYWYNRKLVVAPHKRKWLWIKANSI